MVCGMFMFVQQCFFGGHQANWGQQAEAMWRNVANEYSSNCARVTRAVLPT